jgi:hypothetical protein
VCCCHGTQTASAAQSHGRRSEGVSSSHVAGKSKQTQRVYSSVQGILRTLVQRGIFEETGLPVDTVGLRKISQSQPGELSLSLLCVLGGRIHTHADRNFYFVHAPQAKLGAAGHRCLICTLKRCLSRHGLTQHCPGPMVQAAQSAAVHNQGLHQHRLRMSTATVTPRSSLQVVQWLPQEIQPALALAVRQPLHLVFEGPSSCAERHGTQRLLERATE